MIATLVSSAACRTGFARPLMEKQVWVGPLAITGPVGRVLVPLLWAFIG